MVDSSLASLNSLGSKPLRLDGILFLGEHPHEGDGDDNPVQHNQYQLAYISVINTSRVFLLSAKAPPTYFVISQGTSKPLTGRPYRKLLPLFQNSLSPPHLPFIPSPKIYHICVGISTTFVGISTTFVGISTTFVGKSTTFVGKSTTFVGKSAIYKCCC